VKFRLLKSSGLKFPLALGLNERWQRIKAYKQQIKVNRCGRMKPAENESDHVVELEQIGV